MQNFFYLFQLSCEFKKTVYFVQKLTAKNYGTCICNTYTSYKEKQVKPKSILKMFQVTYFKIFTKLNKS